MFQPPLMKVRESRLQFFGRVVEHSQRAVVFTAEDGAVFASHMAMIPSGVLRTDASGGTKQMVPDRTAVTLGQNPSLEFLVRHAPPLGGLPRCRSLIEFGSHIWVGGSIS